MTKEITNKVAIIVLKYLQWKASEIAMIAGINIILQDWCEKAPGKTAAARWDEV